MNLRLNGLVLLMGLLIGSFGTYRFLVKPVVPPPPLAKSAKKTIKNFDPASGKLLSEVVVESNSNPIPNPKPAYKITGIAIWDRESQKAYYAGLYEKRYDLPIIRESYVGIYLNSKLDYGLSLSKEFY